MVQHTMHTFLFLSVHTLMVYKCVCSMLPITV